MRVFVTGATGFIGGNVVRALRERGDEVVALVRSPQKAADLIDHGASLVEGDLADTIALAEGMRGANAVIHAAAWYEVGIPADQREAMLETNVGGTRRVFAAAEGAGVQRIVHVSSMAAIGDTHHKVVDESSSRTTPYATIYDESKHKSHQVALERIAAGAPIVIVQPGGIYGPGDHSQLGNLVDQFLAGTLPAVVFPNGGVLLAHVDDVVAGILAAMDKGRLGETYILGGDQVTMVRFVQTLAEVTGRRAPRLTIPDVVMRALAPLGPVLGPRMGYPPNFRELVRTGTTTYWGSSDKARRELGYNPRPLADVLRDTLSEEGRLT